jgi:hypothetical protein
MRKSDIVYTTGCAFAAATAFFYCCVMWFHIRLPRYYPTEHVWKWAKEKGVVSQGWYGMQAFAYLSGGVVALVAYLLLKYRASEQSELKGSTIKLIALVTFVVVLVCMGYIMYHEFAKSGIL